MDTFKFPRMSLITIAVTYIQSALLALFISSIDIASAIYIDKQSLFLKFRPYAILLSCIIYASTKILLNNQILSQYTTFLLLFLSHALFNLFFVVSFPSQVAYKYKDSFFLFNRIQIHLGLLLNVLVCGANSFFLTFINHKVNLGLSYTDVQGLFLYLRLSIYKALYRAYRLALYELYGMSVFSLSYIIILGTILRLPLFLLRIYIVYHSIIELFNYIIILSITIFLFLSVIEIIEYLITYNCSFVVQRQLVFEGSSSLNGQRYYLHQINSIYKHNISTKLKNSVSILRDLTDYSAKEIKYTVSLINNMITAKNDLDSSMYVTVPQVNKNFIKKVKSYDIISSIRCRVKYYIDMAILSRRYSFMNKILCKIISFHILLNRRESLGILNAGSLCDIKTLSEKLRNLDKTIGIPLETYELSTLISKALE